MSNYYSIAGLVVEMEPQGRTAVQAEPYRIPKEGKINMRISADFGAFQQKYPYLNEDEAWYAFSTERFYSNLLLFNGMMLHSSAVVVDGRAYLFSASSGTGKSTHTKLWLDKFGDRAYILNDDKPALRLIDGVWYACGTPWSGKYDISKPECVPLAGIAMVHRAEDNRIERYRGVVAIHELLQQTMRPKDRQDKLLELLDKLVSAVPIWKLYCNMDPQAAEVSYSAMSGEEKE